jgi:hypothetical protein
MWEILLEAQISCTHTYMEHLATLGKIPFININIIIIMSLCFPCKLKAFFRTPTKQKQH